MTANVKTPLIPPMTECIHTLTQSRYSILSLATSDHYIFGGTESGVIYVWDTRYYALVQQLEGHKSHVLSLCISTDCRWLFSGGDDGSIRCWQIDNVEPGAKFPCVCLVHAAADSGDIHSIVYSASLDAIYFGCKNASIQFFDMRNRHSVSRERRLQEWKKRDSRFFDLVPLLDCCSERESEMEIFVVFEDENVLPMCHQGFVYALLVTGLSSGVADDCLISGSGDGTIKIWDISSLKPSLLRRIRVTDGSVLSLCMNDGYLYTGCQDGELKVWDVETYQCIRSLMGHSDNIHAVVGSQNVVFSTSAEGVLKKWNNNFECVETVAIPSSGILLCLDICRSFMVSGGSDNLLKIWSISGGSLATARPFLSPIEDKFLTSLRNFVSFKSISGNTEFSSQSIRCAKYLKSVFLEMGADSKIVPGKPGKNPIVLAKYNACFDDEKAETVLIYGHYDVQPAKQETWSYPTFELTGNDGYFYGRGVSDNKGPILAMLFAVSDLHEKRLLGVNVCFAIEGEEEAGSDGFVEAIHANSAYLGKIDLILFSNSYWLDDETPCLTYGLRGVIHSKLQISNPIKKDLHSGVDGGMHQEPLGDMVRLLGKLISDEAGSKTIMIPGFSDNVRSVSDEERLSFEKLLKFMPVTRGYTVDHLLARWTKPTLTIHQIEVSGPASNTVIPGCATALVSMRIVPDQDVDEICRHFEDYLHAEFAKTKSKNELSILIGHRAGWWLENVKTEKYYTLAAAAIQQEWKTSPLFVREGGSIPAIPFLKQFFNASVLQIPMGQASDNAHLPNERMSFINLTTGKRVIQRFLSSLAQIDSSRRPQTA